MKHLEVLFKSVAICNQACDYCYYLRFNRKAYIGNSIVQVAMAEKIADFLKQGCDDLNPDTIDITFHGGEPLLQSKESFRLTCQYFRERFPKGKNPKLSLYVQTNGLLIDSEWLDLFSKFNINLGISLDGFQKCHDKHRKDTSGAGTYQRIIENLNLVQKYVRLKKIKPIGITSVIDPQFSAKEIYRHLVHDLGMDALEFFLPDLNYDNFYDHAHRLWSNSEIKDFGRFLCELFDAWTEDDNPKIQIGAVGAIMKFLSGQMSSYSGFGPQFDNLFPIITIYDNGLLSPNDLYITTEPNLLNTNSSVESTNLKTFLKHPTFSYLRKLERSIPDDCNSCPWKNICFGGALVHRYKKGTGYNNKSIYCEALQMLFKKVTSYMVKSGFDIDQINRVLFPKKIRNY